jgi:hypothetical protein
MRFRTVVRFQACNTRVIMDLFEIGIKRGQIEFADEHRLVEPERLAQAARVESFAIEADYIMPTRGGGNPFARSSFASASKRTLTWLPSSGCSPTGGFVYRDPNAGGALTFSGFFSERALKVR